MSRGEKPVLGGGDVLVVKGLAEDQFLGFFAFAAGFVSLDYFVQLVLELLGGRRRVGLVGLHPVNTGLKAFVLFCIH